MNGGEDLIPRFISQTRGGNIQTRPVYRPPRLCSVLEIAIWLCEHGKGRPWIALDDDARQFRRAARTCCWSIPKLGCSRRTSTKRCAGILRASGIEEQAMRIHVLSDLHFEFQKWRREVDVNSILADVTVLAGDIAVGLDGIAWALKAFKRPVVYVMGNHEFYGQRPMAEVIQKRKRNAPGRMFICWTTSPSFLAMPASSAAPCGPISTFLAPIASRNAWMTPRKIGRTFLSSTARVAKAAV